MTERDGVLFVGGCDFRATHRGLLHHTVDRLNHNRYGFETITGGFQCDLLECLVSAEPYRLLVIA